MVKNNKYCSVYVNDMHLVVMLMPYIEKELEKGEKIVTIFEESLKKEIDLFFSKVNLKGKKKDKIKNINWNKNKLTKKEITNIKDKIVLIKGGYEYIKNINELLNEKENLTINCFEFGLFENKTREILKNHDCILNTSGIKKIPDLFNSNCSQSSILT